MYDLKEAFHVSFGEVRRKIQASFVPGQHKIILRHPDLYGPLMGVFLLPQVLLSPLPLSASSAVLSCLLVVDIAAVDGTIAGRV